MGPPGGMPQPGRRIAEDDAARRVLRGGAGAGVQQHQQHAVARGDEPDVGLPAVEVEGLDHAGVHLGVVDLFHLEAAEGRVRTRGQPTQLDEGPAVVGEALEVHDLHAGDGRLRRVVLQRVGALGGVAEIHPTSPTSLRSPSMKVNERGLLWVR